MAANNGNALPIGYKLDEYILQSVLGQGGFGITYLARDARLSAQVAIKEYFPQAYAERDSTRTIRPNTHGSAGDVENYRWGLQEFLKEARALAKFKHPNIVRVLRFLEANGTAYMVMEYEEGESLSTLVNRQGGFLAEPTLLGIFLPVLNGLQAVHDAGLLHLDIKPDNIYLRRSGQPMIIDFGAARQRSGSDRSEKIALTPGYAALEQYPGYGELGTWSDVYSMGATLYRCITGREPMDSRERAQAMKKLLVDPNIPATRFDRPLYSAHIRTCVDAAMSLKAEDRPPSAFALQNGLMGKDMNAARSANNQGSFKLGAGYRGAPATVAEKKRRFIPRGPLERLLVFLVFLAVLIVAPLRIMLSTGDLTEEQLFDLMDQTHLTSIESGKRLVRYLEENLLGVKRAPDYVPTNTMRQVASRAVVKADEEKPVPPFETARKLAATISLPAPAMSIAVLQGGKAVAIAFEDGTVGIHALAGNRPMRTLQAATGVPGVVAASADGRRLALTAANNTIEVRDIEKNVRLSTISGHVDAVIALAFSPDGSMLASVGRDQTAVLWAADSGQALHDLTKPANEPLSLGFSPDGGMLAIGDSAGGIRYWDLGQLRDIAYVPTRDIPVTALAYAPSGKWFAVGGEQNLLALWDVSGQQPDRPLGPAPDTVHALVFTPDSKWLLVAGSDRALQLWDVGTARLAQRYEGANQQTFALALAPEGAQIMAAGADMKFTLWK